MMEFIGKVHFRSSVNPNCGPPGEAEIHTLNPRRVKRIMEVTGWGYLEPGSLNIEVETSVVDDLLTNVNQ